MQKYAFDLLLEPQPDKNYNVPSVEELVNEALFLVLAGTDTTTYAAAHATYYVLTHSKVLKQLKEELKSTVRENGGQLDWGGIRNLPYLVRCRSSCCALLILTNQCRPLLSKKRCVCRPLSLGYSLA